MITSNNNFSTLSSGTIGTTTDTFLGINTYVDTSLGVPSISTSTRLITPTPENMNTQQVKVAVFAITRDVDTNEINSAKFVKELWIERKNGASIDLIVAKQLDKDFDPETTVIKQIHSITF